MENIDLEEKVKTLEEKVNNLEKIEKRRQRIKWIKIFLKIIVYLIIIVFIYVGYRYIKNNYIEPFDNLKKEIIEKLDGLKEYDFLEKFGLK